MKVLTQLDDVCQEFFNSSIALGTFDGIHIGHQKIISRAVQLAESMNGSSVVFTFSNHPFCVLAPDRCPPQIMSQQSKIDVIEKMGVDALLSISLTKEFLHLSPVEFIEKLVKRLKPVHLVVGPNYSFGYKGRGTPGLLHELGAKYGFDTNVLDAVYVGDTMVSSTLIRRMIAGGEVEKAAELLGRPFVLDGKVIKGDGRGRLLGYPTANLAVADGFLLPGDGVYAVNVSVANKQYWGMANIGNNPTFNLNSHRLEIHILDFTGDLYNQSLQVQFIRSIRKEIKFTNSEALQQQLMLDTDTTRAILKQAGSTVH